MKPWILASAVVALSGGPAAAQPASSDPPVAVELVAGHAGFVDDATRHHAVVGGAVRWYLSPRVSVGPEVVFMPGPDGDRNLMATGNVTFDIRQPGAGRRVTPFLVAGGGLFHHRARFGTQTFASGEGAFTAGGGVRVPLSARWHMAGEWRLGWELQSSVNVVIGVR
jgi:hypothetical protein